jgi:hypothetical protein
VQRARAGHLTLLIAVATGAFPLSLAGGKAALKRYQTKRRATATGR